jgi:hypothetical protein
VNENETLRTASRGCVQGSNLRCKRLYERESCCSVSRFKKALFRHQYGASTEWDVEESVVGPRPSLEQYEPCHQSGLHASAFSLPVHLPLFHATARSSGLKLLKIPVQSLEKIFSSSTRLSFVILHRVFIEIYRRFRDAYCLHHRPLKSRSVSR